MLLQVHNLVAAHGSVTVLRGVSFSVAAGDVAVVLGASGAGKTSLLRAISGLLRRTGHITFAGHDIVDLEPATIARLGMGHVPQGRGAFTDLTVLENLRLGGIRRPSQRQMRADIRRMFSLFPPLASRATRLAGTLSGGEQQMLAIARALMARPRLMLLDEPTRGLAPLVAAQVFAALTELRAGGVTMVIAEQNAQLALPLATSACVLEAGLVSAQGTPQVLMADEHIKRTYLGQ